VAEPHTPPAVEGDYFFVRRPIVAIVISILTVVVGVVAMTHRRNKGCSIPYSKHRS
jgi:hypothetical protein